jgi:CBS-domain-containing membrane protein
MHAQTLGAANILSAPVLDEDGEYFGCISVNDLLKALYQGLHATLWRTLQCTHALTCTRPPALFLILFAPVSCTILRVPTQCWQPRTLDGLKRSVR